MEEITADYSVNQLSTPPALLAKPRVTFAAKTDLGRVRENNEDKFEFYVPEDELTLAGRGQIFLVCDGMGGHAAGQIASELACKTFIDVYLHHPGEDPELAMRTGVQAANRYVYDVGNTVAARRGMGTTLSVLILLNRHAYTVQVGDSRVYRLRGNDLRQLTHDHTWVDEAVRQGMITEAEAATHPMRHVLTRAIGVDPNVECDIDSDETQVGDIYLLCSDGLINHVDDASIMSVLAEYPPSEAAWRLVGLALQGGGSDNCTVTVVRVDDIELADEPSTD